MMIDVKTHAYTLKIEVNETAPAGTLETKLIYQKAHEKEELILEKTATVAQVKQMMDGIFKELYLATETKTC